MVEAHTFNPSTPKAEASTSLFESEASYTVSSRTTGDTVRNRVKKQKENNKM